MTPLPTAKAIRAEACRANDDPLGKPLPLASHWSTGTYPPTDTFDPRYQLALIARGHHLLPFLTLPQLALQGCKVVADPQQFATMEDAGVPGAGSNPVEGQASGGMTMLRWQGVLTLSCTSLLFTVLSLPPVAPAADREGAKQGGKVAGILIDKKEDWITVKADGEEEPVKYLVGTSDKKLARAMKGIFNASRVQLTYKQDGESRQLVSIKKQVLRASGTVTGTVVKVYNDFWVEVKPRNGLADAYAPSGANYKKKDFMERLRVLKPGDSVTIKFTTSSERHRIVTLLKN
jgi:hypothetical protein